VDTDGKIGIKVFEDGTGSEATFEFFECGLAFGRPVEALAFSEKGSDAGDDAGISFNKAAVEVGKAEKYLDFFNVCGRWPFLNGDDAIRIHGDAFR
jgi:hypothetical protein